MRIGSLSNFIFITKEADKQFKNLSRLIRKLSTGRKVELPYTSPEGVYESESLRGLISKTKLYEDNIKFAKGYLLTIDDTLGKVYQTVLEVKTKLIQFANSGGDKQVAKDTLTELKNRLLQLAKTKIGDYYLFSGDKPTQEPFDSNNNYQGGDAEFYVKVADNDNISLFPKGDDIFGSGSDSLFAKIQNAIDNISDKSKVRQAIGDMENFLKKVDRIRSKVGLAEQKLESYELTYSNLLDNLKKRLSQIEDTDMPGAIAEYKRVQTSYQALLSLLGNEENRGSYLLKYF